MNTAWIFVGLLVASFVTLNIIARRKMKNIAPVTNHEKIVTLTDINFENKTRNKLVLIDFWASWCAPCRMMGPILNDAAAELGDAAQIGKVNIEENQSLAQKFKIRSIPTMVLLKNGAEVARFSGVKSKDYILKQIHQFQ